jgi:hypothetical protein
LKRLRRNDCRKPGGSPRIRELGTKMTNLNDVKLARVYSSRRNNRFKRFVVVAVALLISNIAALSCAMAYAMCAECPDNVPALCADPCATTNNLISDTAIDHKAESNRPFSDPHTLLPADLALEPAHPSVGDKPDTCNYSSPPLYLQFCVFLK